MPSKFKDSSSEAKRNREVSAKNTKVSKQSSLRQKLDRTVKTVAKPTGLTARVFDVQGKSAGTVALPKEIFGQKPNPRLLSQAIKVYQANISPHSAHTKTRGEVRGGGAKPWRQKGTGRARAGSRRSPLWVGGGTTFGPRFREAKLTLPKKMRHIALIYALSDKAQEGGIKIITGIEKISPKTKIIATLLRKLETPQNVLLVISQKNSNINLATRNIPGITTDLVNDLNAYKILKNRQLLISKEALSKFA